MNKRLLIGGVRLRNMQEHIGKEMYSWMNAVIKLHRIFFWDGN